MHTAKHEVILSVKYGTIILVFHTFYEYDASSMSFKLLFY